VSLNHTIYDSDLKHGLLLGKVSLNSDTANRYHFGRQHIPLVRQWTHMGIKMLHALNEYMRQVSYVTCHDFSDRRSERITVHYKDTLVMI